MKNILLIFAAILSMATVSIAQSSFAIKGGVNFANLAVDSDVIDDNKTKTGFTVGIVNLNNYGNIGFQTELLYTRKGAEYTFGNTTVEGNLDYIEIPLTLQVPLGPISIYAGGYGGFLMSAKYKYGEGDNETITFDDKDAFNKLDYGLLGGVALDLGKIIIDGRFTRGLRDVENGDRIVNAVPYEGNSTKNYGFQVTAGIKF